MPIYNTGNALGSTDFRDGVDNLDALDDVVNSAEKTTLDRFGNQIYTLAGLAELATGVPAVEASLAANEFKLAAEIAAEIASQQADIYPTTAAAIADAGLPDQAYFNVPAAAPEDSIVLYKKASGVAVEIKRYPASPAQLIYRGSLTGVNLNAYLSQGMYIFSSCTNQPPGITTGVMTVQKYGDYVVQTAMTYLSSGVVYRRTLRISTGVDYGWNATTVPAGSITAPHLSAGYNYRGMYSTGNFNALLASGSYLITGALLNAPALISSVSGTLVVNAVDAEWVVQSFYELNAPHICHRRQYRISTGAATPWAFQYIADLSVTTAKLANSSVVSEKLSGNFNYRGEISSGSTRTLLAAGVYLVTAAIEDLPSGVVSGYLDVAVHGGWVKQTFCALSKPSEMYARHIRVSTPVYGAWERVGTAGSGPFFGKTIAFVGDSITEGGDYPERVASRLGCTALKFGFGGCRMGEHSIAEYDTMSMYNLARYINEGDYTDLIDGADALFAAYADDNRAQAAAFSTTNWATVDCLVIFFGTNDFGTVPIGTDADTDGTTFKGAINYTVDKILSAYPHLKILFVAPMWRARLSAGDGLDADTNQKNGTWLIDYTDAVKSRAAAHKIPSLDMYRESGINKYNHATLLADGLHPASGIGYQRVADKIAAALLASY